MKKLVCCSLLLTVPPTFATIAPVQSAATWGASGTTCMASFAPTTHNMIAVWASWTTGSSPNNITATTDGTPVRG